MDLTPQSLHSVEFREARRGGYNTRDVDDFIERVVAGAGQLHERVREAQMRSDAADARLAELQREVEDLRSRPSTDASETDETLRRTLVLAQRTADATIKEAKEEANRVLSEAREEAARTRAEAEAAARRGADSARVNAEAEVETLLSNRDKLKADLDALTRRIDEQRGQLRNGIDEMQRLLDDPNALKPLPPVTLAEVDRPVPLPAAPAGPQAGAPADDTGGNVHNLEAPPADVAALQEAPSGPADLGAPTQAVPFALAGEGNRQWQPSELQGSGDEPLGPPPPAPASNGAPPPPPEPSARPGEWGRAVFEPETETGEGERARFGRRR
jgi:DivIVA domain-containing protein